MSTVRITASPDAVARHLNPAALVRNLWRHRGLIAQFTRREIEGRYKSSVLGFGWSFVTPLVLLLIYTFVFGVVFRSRWPGTKTTSLSEFGLVLFAGLIAFNIFSECLLRASALIVSVPNYVKRVVFPLESNLYGRSLSAAAPPHRFLPGVKGGFYSWDQARLYPEVILVEGLFDYAALWQAGFLNVTVQNGVVELWGTITDERERQALIVAAQNIPGVKDVRDHLVWVEPMSGVAIGPGGEVIAA